MIVGTPYMVMVPDETCLLQCERGCICNRNTYSVGAGRHLTTAGLSLTPTSVPRLPSMQGLGTSRIPLSVVSRAVKSRHLECSCHVVVFVGLRLSCAAPAFMQRVSLRVIQSLANSCFCCHKMLPACSRVGCVKL